MFPKRKSIRIPEFNYARCRYYFITICTHHCVRWFGDVVEDKIVLNDYGKIVENIWYGLPDHYSNCELHSLVIMPNHVHGIIFVGEGFKPSRKKRYDLCEMVRGFKTFSSKKINQISLKRFQWQRSFYDHIIRNDEDMYRIQEYMANNPLQWSLDEYY